MAQLLSPLPSIIFPHELAYFKVGGCDPLEQVYLIVSFLGSDAPTLSYPLYADANGMLNLSGLADYVRDNFPGTGQETLCVEDHGREIFTVDVFPFALNTLDRAADFLRSRYLSCIGSSKRVYEGAREYLHTIQPLDEIAATLYYYDPLENAHKTERVALEQEDGAYVVPTSSDNGVLGKVEVYGSGMPLVTYHIMPTHDADPTTLLFENSWGRWDTFHFYGTVKRTLKLNRTTARLRGELRNLRQVANEQLTFTLPTFDPESASLFLDLCRSKRVQILGSDGSYIVTDHEADFEMNNPYAFPSGSVTIQRVIDEDVDFYLRSFERKADSAEEVLTQPMHRVFDNSFELAFQ